MLLRLALQHLSGTHSTRILHHCGEMAIGLPALHKGPNVKLNKKACKKVETPPPPPPPPSNTFLPKMPFSYQLEVLEFMEASMRTTFTTKRTEMATQMTQTRRMGRDSLPHTPA